MTTGEQQDAPTAPESFSWRGEGSPPRKAWREYVKKLNPEATERDVRRSQARLATIVHRHARAESTRIARAIQQARAAARAPPDVGLDADPAPTARAAYHVCGLSPRTAKPGRR
jgi:hypothetical protein